VKVAGSQKEKKPTSKKIQKKMPFMPAIKI